LGVEVKEELRPFLSRKVILLSIIWFAIFLPISELIFFYNNKPSTYFGYPMVFFWTILLFLALGKWNPLRLNSAELIAVWCIVSFLGGSRCLSRWTHTEQILRLADMTYGIIPLGLRDIPEIYGPLTPAYLFPIENREALVSILYEGLTPGQVFPWSAFVLPLTIFSIYSICLMFISFAVVFGIIGKPWADIEKLTWPVYGLPLVSMTQYTFEERRLYNFKDRRMRVFWVAVIIGAFFAITPILIELLPAMPLLGSFQFGEMNIVILPGIHTILPGVLGNVWWVFPQFFVGLVVPNDILMTCVFVWIFESVYNAIALQAGWYVSYTPGQEVTGWSGALPFGQYPVNFYAQMVPGGGVATGLLLLWAARHRLKEIWSAMRGRDIIEHGLSLKFIGLFGIGSFIFIIAFLGILGVPVIIAIWWLTGWILYYTMTARAAAMYWDHPADSWNLWKTSFALGHALGYWPAEPSANQSLYNTLVLMNYGHNSWIPRCGGFYNITGIAPLYYYARTFNVNLKHLLIMLIAITVIGVPLTFFTEYWFLVHGGGFANTNTYKWCQWMPYGAGLAEQWWWSGGNLQMEVIWFIAGFIHIFLIYGLKAVFPRLPINPFFWAPAILALDWYWFTALVSLIVKVIAIRVVGPKTYMEYSIAFVTGAMAGFGAVFAIASFHQLFTVAIPTFLSRYVP
jgi:hypothetical protein